MSGLILALGTKNDGLAAVSDCEVISEKMAERDMMSAIETEFLAIQPLDNLFQGFDVLIELFLLFGHDFLQK
jgi:hypothetical protein